VAGRHAPPAPRNDNLADVLERVLDKGIVIAGDIQINLVDVELLTIRLRLLVASVDKAREMGINWWEGDPTLSLEARDRQREESALEDRLRRLEAVAGIESSDEHPDRGREDDARDDR
jgi:hypothetical protein